MYSAALIIVNFRLYLQINWELDARVRDRGKHRVQPKARAAGNAHPSRRRIVWSAAE